MPNARYHWWLKFWDGRRGGCWPGEDENRADLPRLYRNQARVLTWLIEGHSVRRMLELGCGDGQLYDHLELPHVDYWGVDFRASAIETLRQRHPALHLFDADAATFRVSQQFDVIFSFGLLQQFDTEMVRQHLHNAHAMLPYDGLLIMADFRWRSYQLQQMLTETAALVRAGSLSNVRRRLSSLNLMRHSQAYSRSHLEALGTEAGFATEFFGSFGLPGYLTARLTKTRPRPSTPAE